MEIMVPERETRRRKVSFHLPNHSEKKQKQKDKEQEKQTSMNNLGGNQLYDAAYYQPNDETLAAIEEAMSGKVMEVLDLDHFEETFL